MNLWLYNNTLLFCHAVQFNRPLSSFSHRVQLFVKHIFSLGFLSLMLIIYPPLAVTGHVVAIKRENVIIIGKMFVNGLSVENF